MLNIQHGQLLATINALGAELSSLQLNAQEFLWQGNNDIWPGRAPILFPIVGTLANDEMRYHGKTYQMMRHGIARKTVFDCIAQTHSDLSMRLRSDEQSLAMYPWDFELTVHFSLNIDTLSITYEVKNLDSDIMIFTLGSHPAFLLPTTDFASNELALTDFDIQFEVEESLRRVMLNDAGLLSTTSNAFELDNNTIKLSNALFQQDALVFKHIESRQITLRVNQKPRLVVDTGGAPHLGIWAKPGARFVCIEPWFGVSDYVDSDGNFENKSDMLLLQPNDTFSHIIRITVA